MIKLILLDFTGVIVTGGHKQLCQQLAEESDFSADHIYEVVYTKYFNKFAVNEISEEENWAGPLRELGIDKEWQEVRDMYLQTHQLNTPMVDFVKELRTQYKAVILTKNYKKYLDWERVKFGLDDLVDDIINTQELGLPKMSDQTLGCVLDTYHVNPQEIIYIDDQEANLTPAGELGVHAVLYGTFEQVKQEVEIYLGKESG